MRQMGLAAIYPKPALSRSDPDHRLYPYTRRGVCRPGHHPVTNKRRGTTLNSTKSCLDNGFHLTSPRRNAFGFNMAECELAVLGGQCLDRRIPSLDVLRQEIAAWQGPRNARQTKIHW